MSVFFGWLFGQAGEDNFKIPQVASHAMTVFVDGLNDGHSF
jgi:hypothetical protein